jgi:hypothetical protein
MMQVVRWEFSTQRRNVFAETQLLLRSLRFAASLREISALMNGLVYSEKLKD